MMSAPSPDAFSSASDEILRNHGPRLDLDYMLDGQIIDSILSQATDQLTDNADGRKIITFAREAAEVYILFRYPELSGQHQEATASYHRNGLDFIEKNPDATAEEIIAHMELVSRQDKDRKIVPKGDRVAIYRFIMDRALSAYF